MPSPTTSTAPNTAAVFLSPPPLSAPDKWGPYSSAKDFDANMATVLVALVCATAAAFALHAAFSLLIRRLRLRRSPPPSPPAPEAAGKPSAEAPPPSPHLPGPVVFSSGATPVAGAPECSICLAELAQGDRVRVLPACGHGFHAHCVDAWLVGGRRSSCPTCRADCRPPPPPVAEP